MLRRTAFAFVTREAGQGEPLVSLHGAGGMKLYHSHELYAAQYRVIIFQVPGFGQSPANERSQSMSELALTMAQAVTNLGIERFNLMGNSFGGQARALAGSAAARTGTALLLVAPAAIRPEGGCAATGALPQGTYGQVVRASGTSGTVAARGAGDKDQATGLSAPRHGTGAGRGVGAPPRTLINCLDSSSERVDTTGGSVLL